MEVAIPARLETGGFVLAIACIKRTAQKRSALSRILQEREMGRESDRRAEYPKQSGPTVGFPVCSDAFSWVGHP